MKCIGKLTAVSILFVLCATTQAKLKVVATLPDLAAIAREIGGDQVEITCLALPTEDPHFVDPKPAFIVKLNRADALVHGGAELEAGWLPALLDRTRNRKIAPGAAGNIRANRNIQLLEIPATLDRSQGDVHAMGNPHYLTDPANARIVAGNLAEIFSQLDPTSSTTYRANEKKFNDTLESKLTVWQKLLAPYKGQHIVSYHDSWPYFSRRFGVKIDLFLEPKPGIPPTPAHLAEVETKMKQENAKVIFVEPYLNRRTAESIARKTGAAIIAVSQFPGGVKGTEGGYLQCMDYTVQSLAKALGETAAK